MRYTNATTTPHAALDVGIDAVMRDLQACLDPRGAGEADRLFFTIV